MQENFNTEDPLGILSKGADPLGILKKKDGGILSQGLPSPSPSIWVDPEELKKRYQERVGSGTAYLNAIIDQKRFDPNFSQQASDFIRTAKDLNIKGLRPERTSLVYNFFGNDINKDGKARDSFISSSYAGTYYSESPDLRADYEKSDLKNILTPRQFTGLKSLSFGKESEYQNMIKKLTDRDGAEKEIAKLDLDKIGINIDQDAAASMFNQNKNMDIASNIYSKATNDSPIIEERYRQIDYENPYTIRSFGNIIKGAVNRGLAVGNTADILTATSKETGIDVERLASLQKEMQDAKATKVYEQFSNNPSFENFKKNPIGIMLELGLESLTALYSHGSTRMAAGAASGATMGSVVPGIGTAAGASTGVIAGMGMASLNLEYSSKILEGLSNLGVNMTDAESLRKAFADEKLMSDLKTDGLKKGIPVAIFDMLSAGLAGKIVSKPAKTIVGKVMQGAAETGVQAGLGAAGEASGQLVSEGKIYSPNAVLMEAIGELGPGAVEIAYGNMVESTKRNKLISTKDAVTVASGDKKVLKENLDAQVASGNLTKDQAALISGEISKTESNLSKIPQNLSTAAKADILGLVENKSQLVEQSKNLDDAFKPQVDQQIKQIDEQILSITQKDRNATNESSVQGAGTESNISQPQGTVQGQQEVGQGTGPEREGQVTQANAGDSNISGQGQIAGQELSNIESITPESIQVSNNSANFAQQMESAQSSLGRMGMSVSPYAQEDYDQIASEGGKFLRAAGNKVLSLLKPNGEMVSLVKDASVKAKGAAQAMISRMKDMGGLFMDNYDIYLTPIYEKAGYKVVARVPFNEQYAPEGWNAEDSPLKNKPDVVFMVRNDIAPEQAQTFNDYEEAQNYTQGLVDKAVNDGIAQTPVQIDRIGAMATELSDDLGSIDKAIEEVLPNAQKSLKGTGIKFKIVDGATQTADAKAARGNQGLFVSDNGTIIIDKSKLADEVEAGLVVWHEASHPVMNIIRNTNKPLYDSVVRGLNEAAKTNAGVANALNWAKTQPQYDNVDTQNDEAIVETIGRINSGLIDVAKLGTGLRQKLIDFVNSIAKFFGIDPILDDTDLAAFKKTVSQVADALKTGRDIGEVVGQENVMEYDAPEYQARVQDAKKDDNPAFFENVKDFANKSSFANKIKFKEAVQDLLNKHIPELRKKYGKKLDPSVYDELSFKYLSDILTKEAFNAILSHPEAIGWYDEKTQSALAAISAIHPEIATDLEARGAFILPLAVMSNGNKVDKNFELAEQQYKTYKNTGRFNPNGDFGAQQVGIKKSLKLINSLLDEGVTMSDINDFLTSKHKAGDLKYRKKDGKLGDLVSGELASEDVYGAVVLGPKIGNGFYMNLWGEFGQLTMDRWFMRTWGRLTGTLIKRDKALINSGKTRLNSALADVKADKEAMAILRNTVGTLSGKSVTDIANAIEKASAKKELRNSLSSNTKTDELRKAGNSLAKLVRGEKEAPSTGEERKFIRDVFSDIQTRLSSEYGIDITMADLQAVLWYPEKILYESFKEGESFEDASEGYTEDSAPDYFNAAKKLALKLGSTNEQINQAVSEGRRGDAGSSGGTDTRGSETASSNYQEVLKRIRVIKGGQPDLVKKSRSKAQASVGNRKNIGSVEINRTDRDFNGLPISSVNGTVYHRTNSSVSDILENGFIVPNQGRAKYGYGVYFNIEPKQTSFGSNQMAADLSGLNLIDLTGIDELDQVDEFNKAVSGDGGGINYNEVTNNIKQAGIDGVISGSEVVVFDSNNLNNIREASSQASVGNRNIFNEELPDSIINSVRASLRKKAPDSTTLQYLDELQAAKKDNTFVFEGPVSEMLDNGVTLNNIASMLLDDEIFEDARQIRNYFDNIGGPDGVGILLKMNLKMQASVGNRTEQSKDFKVAAFVMRKLGEGADKNEIAQGVASATGMSVADVNKIIADPEQYIRDSFPQLSKIAQDNLIERAKIQNIYRGHKFGMPINKAFVGTEVPRSKVVEYLNKTNKSDESFKESVKDFNNKWLDPAKGLPDWVLAIRDFSVGRKNIEIARALKTIERLKDEAEKIGFKDWKAFSKAMVAARDVQRFIPDENGLALFDPYRASEGKMFTTPDDMLPAVIPDELKAIPESLRPFAIQMRNQIDGLTKDLIGSGYVTPDQAVTLEKNLGQYVNRAYKMYNERGFKPNPDQVVEATKFIADKKIKQILTELFPAGKPSKSKAVSDFKGNVIDPDNVNMEELYRQAIEEAKKDVQAILDKKRNPYFNTKTDSRDTGILKKKEDIPEPIRKLMGEYTDPGTVFVMTVAKQAALNAQSEYLRKMRDFGMGNIFFEKNDKNRPAEFSVEIAPKGTDSKSPLGGLYTTPEIAEALEMADPSYNELTNLWMKLVGLVRWGKTVGSVATQAKNFESNVGFAVLNGMFLTGENTKALGAAAKYVKGQYSKAEIDQITEKVIKLNLVGQSVGARELAEMFGSGDIHDVALDIAANPNNLFGKKVKKSVNVFSAANKLYRMGDDFWKVYAYINEREMVANGRFKSNYESLTTEQQEKVDIESSERVKNTWPTYDRVVEGAKYVSKRAPIFGNFISFQAESLRVLANSIKLAREDMKDPEMKAAGVKRMVGIISYVGLRALITTTVAHAAGMAASGILGAALGDDEEEQKKRAIKKAIPVYARTADVAVVPSKDPHKFTVFSLSSLDPYGIIPNSLNALTEGREGIFSKEMQPGVPAAAAEFFSGFLEPEMTFSTMYSVLNNINPKTGRPIVLDSDTSSEIAKKVGSFVVGQLEPSTILMIERGMERGWSPELASFAGARPIDVDLHKSFGYVLTDMSKQMDAIKSEYNAVKYNDKYSEKEKAEAELEAERKKAFLISKVSETYRDFIKTGANPSILNEMINERSSIKTTGFDRTTKRAIKTGEVKSEKLFK